MLDSNYQMTLESFLKSHFEHEIVKILLLCMGIITYPYSGFTQASISKIQGLFKDFSSLSYSFQGLKVYEKSWFKC